MKKGHTILRRALATATLSASILGLVSPSLATGRQVEASGGPIEAAKVKMEILLILLLTKQ